MRSLRIVAILALIAASGVSSAVASPIRPREEAKPDFMAMLKKAMEMAKKKIEVLKSSDVRGDMYIFFDVFSHQSKQV